MIYILYITTALIGTAFLWAALKAFGVYEIKPATASAEENAENTEKTEKGFVPYDRTQVIIILIAFLLGAFAIAAAIGKNTVNVDVSVLPVSEKVVFMGRTAREITSYFKLFYVFVIIAISAFIDFKKKIIPNKLVLAGLALRAVTYLVELVWCKDIIKDLFISDLIGLALGFGILFISGLLTKGAIGFGDAKLFAVIGISASSLATFGTLLFSLVASSVAGVILLIKYRDRKRAFPFAPFILIGYSAVMLMGNF